MRLIAWRLLAVLVLVLGAHVVAPAVDAADWEQTGLGGQVLQLYTPASGAFFARTGERFFRSDDGGTTWAPVNLPPAPAPPTAQVVALDPADHTVLYAAGSGGLYKSTDDAASWTLVFPAAERRVLSVAVSPADRALVYLALSGPSISADFWFLRSRDGGATWEQLDEAHNSLCGWSVLILQPHPTDPARAFRTAGCYAGRNLSDVLDQSTDRGATWSRLVDPRDAFPARLVGGEGVAPARFYLAANQDPRGGGSSLFRTDDDGATWTAVLRFAGSGIRPGSTAPNVELRGLAYDPGRPDRVYLAMNRSVGGFPQDRAPIGSGVRVSDDGGVSWTDLGRQDLARVHDLALGIDGQNLYVATDRGLLRLRLAEGPPEGPSGGDAPAPGTGK